MSKIICFLISLIMFNCLIICNANASTHSGQAYKNNKEYKAIPQLKIRKNFKNIAAKITKTKESNIKRRNLVAKKPSVVLKKKLGKNKNVNNRQVTGLKTTTKTTTE